MTGRTYDLVHRTTYRYTDDVSESFGRATVTPRDLPDQHCVASTLAIDPPAADAVANVDYYGNVSTFFQVSTPHRVLQVTARSRVEVTRRVPDVAGLPDVAWEQVAAAVATGQVGDPTQLVMLREMVLPSTHVELDDAVRAWAAPTFVPGRPLRDVVVELSGRIRRELAYRSGSTTVHTTQVELLAQRAGVCQDFAHLMIAALRAHGLPARYTSGYLETRPGPGRPKLRGADASHAWVSVWLPGHGWLDVDPTNERFVDDSYVVLGWGRDYHDVPPLRGVIFTEGSGSTLQVEVDLVPAGVEPFE